MPYREVIAVCSQIHKKHINTLCGQNVELLNINLLTPNDSYSGLTAPLTSKLCNLYIYSTNIGPEYFKHGVYPPFFFLSSKCSLFHKSNIFGSCFIHILYTGYAKIKKKKFRRQKVKLGFKWLNRNVLTEFHCYKKLKILCQHSFHSDSLTKIFEYAERRHSLISRNRVCSGDAVCLLLGRNRIFVYCLEFQCFFRHVGQTVACDLEGKSQPFRSVSCLYV